jgi:hypothetical protein
MREHTPHIQNGEREKRCESPLILHNSWKNEDEEMETHISRYIDRFVSSGDT